MAPNPPATYFDHFTARLAARARLTSHCFDHFTARLAARARLTSHCFDHFTARLAARARLTSHCFDHFTARLAARARLTSHHHAPRRSRGAPRRPACYTGMSVMKVHLTTLGCPKNQVDSELMLGMLAEAGFPLAERAEDAECLIVNTCAFIDRAREESVNTILELAQLKERGRCRSLIVTGCLGQRYGAELFRELPEVDGILGTSELHRVVELARQAAG